MKPDLKLIYMDEVQTGEVAWLWYPYLPRGKLTIIQGDPGEGKTTFVLAVIAALTTGTPLPESGQALEPLNVIYQTAEDQVAQEFAAQAWPDSEVLITTHLDAEHIHSHFLVDAACWGSGRMLCQGPGALKSLRGISGELCMKYGLSILPKQQPKKSRGMSSREYRVNIFRRMEENTGEEMTAYCICKSMRAVRSWSCG